MGFISKLFGRETSSPSLKEKPDGKSLCDLDEMLVGVLNQVLEDWRRQHPDVKKFLESEIEGLKGVIVRFMRKKMDLTIKDGNAHSASLIESGEYLINVTTLPVGDKNASGWYQKEWGGYGPYLDRVLNTPVNERCRLFIHFIIGINRHRIDEITFWASGCIFPFREQYANCLPWWGLPWACLTDKDKRIYGLT